MTNFSLTDKERPELYQLVIDRLEKFYENTSNYSVSPDLDINIILDLVGKNDFTKIISPEEAINNVIGALEKYTVHTPHPKYFGLFNPRTNFPGILADLITAVFNPQLAAWSHAPYAVEVENYLIQEFGRKFGYDFDSIDGVLTSGGAEANLTAVLCALNKSFPEFANNGLIGMKRRPTIYCSSEAHHSIVKAARIAGLGYYSVKNIRSDTEQKMDLNELNQQITNDIKTAHQPFMIIGTAGTTGSGAIDDLIGLHKIADKFDLWFHVDAAYGGASVLSSNMKDWTVGIEKSDSITFDAHKWLSVPMGTSMFFTSNKEILNKTFRITTEYMPKEAQDLQIVEPFTHSIQWSRRFIGLKLYLSLLIFGWKGYEEVIEHQSKMSNLLKNKLIESNWLIKNTSPLPVVCFTDEDLQEKKSFASVISKEIINSGKAWLSVYPIGGINTLRTCITNFSTNKNDIEELVELLNHERKKYKAKAAAKMQHL